MNCKYCGYPCEYSGVIWEIYQNKGRYTHWWRCFRSHKVKFRVDQNGRWIGTTIYTQKFSMHFDYQNDTSIIISDISPWNSPVELLQVNNVLDYINPDNINQELPLLLASYNIEIS